MTHFRVSKINLDDGNVVFFFTTMNIETMAGYVSYFIFQSETPIYPTALFQKHRLKSHYEGLMVLFARLQRTHGLQNLVLENYVNLV